MVGSFVRLSDSLWRITYSLARTLLVRLWVFANREWKLYKRANQEVNLIYISHIQGHPMDPFLKMSFVRANFRWLRDVEKIICSCNESVAGK